MAALVQSLPSPSTSTMTMLQARPRSSDAFQTVGPAPQPYSAGQLARGRYNPALSPMTTTLSSGNPNYRGNTMVASSSTNPMAAPPYMFNPPSPLHAPNANPLRQHPTSTMMPPRIETRTASAPSVPLAQPAVSAASLGSRQRPSLPESSPIASSATPITASGLNTAPVTPVDGPSSQGMPSYAKVAKSSPPDRYRRNSRRLDPATGLGSNPPLSAATPSAMPSGSGMAAVAHLYNHPAQTSSSPALTTYQSYRGAPSPNAHYLPEQALPYQNHSSQQLSPHLQLQPQPTQFQQQRGPAQDDLGVQRQTAELAKRYHRRSIGSLDASEYPPLQSDQQNSPAAPKSYAAMLAGPAPSAPDARRSPLPTDYPSSAAQTGRKEPAESTSSTSSGAKSFTIKRPTESAAQPPSQQPIVVNQGDARLVNVPPRASSTDANKRSGNPSPLSKPMAMSPEMPAGRSDAFGVRPSTATPQSGVMASTLPAQAADSPATQQLAALSKNKKASQKDGQSSRLRRAFSFGSAAELRKASVENNAAASRERNKLQKSQYADEEEAQQAAVAMQQEAAGLGAGIYSGQGHFFTGSTDNLSISSTASSASIMIRKMGKGVKRGSRSLVGLFRPKSVVGVPAADSAVPEPSMAQVSMVTVEAEREKVNVNPNPHDQVGGGTGFPKLERNSLDTAHMATDTSATTSMMDKEALARRSIVGSERDRAEVLAAVKKGILKRAGTDSGNSSPQLRPIDTKTPDFNLPQIPRFSDSPVSTAPTTPVDEETPRGHNKTDSVHIEGEEYFLSIQNYANGQSASLPGTPKGTPRNISFSPRIIFHDTWPSGEYDRRGEVATCNRLTPMLAQQIKEELNTFKMEMEVHAESKVNTHFF